MFAPQVELGADFFVIPSYTPAGLLLDAYALMYGVPLILAYPQWNRILDRDGRELASGGYDQETLRAGFGSPIVQATLNFDSVSLFADGNQEKIRDIQGRYGSKVRVRFDEPSCVFLLESRSHDLTVAELMREFDLISLQRQHCAQRADTSTMNTVPLKFAVIGCGSLAQAQHLPNILKSPRMALVACVDRRRSPGSMPPVVPAEANNQGLSRSYRRSGD